MKLSLIIAITLFSLLLSNVSDCEVIDDETTTVLSDLVQNQHYKALKRGEPVWVVTGVMNIRHSTQNEVPIYKMDVVFLKTNCLKKDVNKKLKDKEINSLAQLSEATYACVLESDFVKRHYKAWGNPLVNVAEWKDL